VAELQFDVDVASGATNVTRLERMIRETDAFVGVYPYDAEGSGPPTKQQLLDASRYFRLELELAARARTPALVFFDRRYGPLLGPPPSMFACAFDYQEITGRGGSPSRTGFRQIIQRFCEHVKASMQYERTRPRAVSQTVGVLLPTDIYDSDLLSDLESRMSAANLEVDRLPFPPPLDGTMVSRIQQFDWVIADFGPTSAQTGLPAYLHGQFIPTLRLSRQLPEMDRDAPQSVLETSLFGAHSAGYPKDIIRWSTSEQLLVEFDKRLARIIAHRFAFAV
jgi:hypothetical protein